MNTSKCMSVLCDCMNGKESDDEVKESDDRCIEKHKNESFTIVETDATMNPRAR